ncbi:hypothetical protein [Chryseobacterium tongliaoense]|uniref:hypothetical protein n=1 Tax=Chryseobacterium tongliaoense TaxID=3240933 RepID=UPI0035140570
MKGLIKMAGVMAVLLLMVSCVVHEYHGRRLPPGQAKKVYGGSARYYAPGQVKKRYYYYDKRYDDDKHRGKGHKKHHRD